EVTLQEDVDPAVAIAGGSLTSGGAQSGTRRLSYSAHDAESGIAKVEVLLGDSVVAVQDFTGACSYADFNACAPGRADDLAVDTRQVPDGAYAVRVRVTDAAGNRRSVQAPSPIQVANADAVPGAANGVGATDTATLRVRFNRTTRPVLTSPYTRQVGIRGRLTDAAGKPIAGAAVEVVEQPTGSGGRPVDRGGARTVADGSFRYTVPKRSSSRSLRFQYRARVGDARVAASQRLKLRVMAAAALRVSLRGILVRYHGRVLSRPLPRSGKLVFIQGRAKGGVWQTFASRRAGRSGRFSGRYRLRVHRPGINLQFRVVVPAESGYGFARRTGRAVTLTVH
ncbi:MAG: DUF4198 domain-containing protein, partial [Actinomycetota bacterium]|nr:DUF4198 domain-containing protein [Actinomycetota bacterium]